jgi:hypothetical protein
VGKNPEQSELGQASEYDPHYNPERLFAISLVAVLFPLIKNNNFTAHPPIELS